MNLVIMEDAIFQVTSITHDTCKFLSKNNTVDVEVTTTIDEMVEDVIGFDCMFFNVETEEEILTMRINIPV